MDQEQFALVEIPVEQQLAALKTAHRYSADLEETVLFAQMLGIIPTTQRATCSQCGGPLEATSEKLWRDRRGDICGACYRKDLKDRKAVEA